jgi:TRAP transporter TAXI family solute receptor
MSTASTRRRFLAQCGALALVSAAGRISTAHGRERGGYVLATATTGGTFYPVGVALATLTKLTLEPTEGIALTAVTSTGSARNIEMMRANEAHFAILQGLYGAHAWTGTGLMAESGPQTWMRSISMLWDNVEHFGVRSSLVTDGTIDDLKSLRGRKFSIGVRESGSPRRPSIWPIWDIPRAPRPWRPGSSMGSTFPAGRPWARSPRPSR